MTRPAILAAFVVGAIVTAWVGRQYQGTDSLALMLVALIAVVFTAGLVECWLRASSVAKALSRAQALPATVQRSALAESDPELERLLSAKSADPAAALSPLTFAPFAVGLVVLLGLLGTFMGLVDTIAGAQNALGATTDVDSLRAALLAPMHGLTRAFGTSVAGVAASALLGFAQVMVRRDENALMTAVASVRVQDSADSAEATQLTLLKELVAQGSALHQLMDARLEERLGDQMEKVLKAQGDAQQKRDEAFYKRMADATKSELQLALSKLESKLGASAEQLTSAFTGAADAFGTNAKTLVEGFQAQSQATLKAAEKEAAALREAGERAQKAAAEQSQKAAADASKSIEATTGKILDAFAQVQQKIEASETARLSADEKRREDDAAVGERLLALTTALEQSAERQEQWAKSSAEALKDAGDRAGSSWSENALVAQESASKAIEALSSSASERLAEQQARLAAFEETLAKEREREQELAAQRSKELAATLEKLAQERAEGIAALEEALDDKRASRESETAERLSALAEKIDARFGEYVDSLQSFEAKLDEVRGEDASKHTAALEAQAREFSKALEATGEAVQKAAGHVGAGGMELEAVAEMFAAAVDQYREISEKWLENLAAVVDRPAAQAAAPTENAELMGGYLDQTRAAFDESLKIQRQMQQEMFSELKTLRGEAS